VNVEEAGRLFENGNGSGNGGGHDRAHLVHQGARVLLLNSTYAWLQVHKSREIGNMALMHPISKTRCVDRVMGLLSRRKETRECFKCNEAGHLARDCPYVVD
jgi:hypothetical protein